MAVPFEQALTGSRPAAGTYVNGIFLASGTTTALSFRGTVRPLSPQEMLTLPEGRIYNQAVTIYTEFQLQVADPDTGINADTVNWLGDDFEVISVDPHMQGFLDHYRVRAVR